jgi:hypothetical protein
VANKNLNIKILSNNFIAKKLKTSKALLVQNKILIFASSNNGGKHPS